MPASPEGAEETGSAIDSLLPGVDAPVGSTHELGRTLVIGERHQIVIRAPVGWRAQGLCFGLVGDPMLFVQSKDKAALVLALDACALAAERCAADAYLAQTAGARDIQWQEPSESELGMGEDGALATVVPGRGRLGTLPARFWQLLLYEGKAPSRPARQILVALDERASAERRGELAAMVAAIRVDARGGRPPTTPPCGASQFDKPVPDRAGWPSAASW